MRRFLSGVAVAAIAAFGVTTAQAEGLPKNFTVTAYGTQSAGYAAMVATAYWSRGQLLEKLGQAEKAYEVYRELLSRPELETYPEYALAKARVSG